MTNDQRSDGRYSQLTADERSDLMSRMRGEGESLQAIADAFGLTRERVRQIIRDADGPNSEQALEARRLKMEKARADLRDLAIEMCMKVPGQTAEAVAEALGVTPAAVRLALGADARRFLVTTHNAQSVFTEQDLLDHLRQAAEIAGEPLTVRMYDEVREQFSGASSPLLLQRFGSWRSACTEAGVEHGQPVRSFYQRRWSRQQLIEAVARYLGREDARGSFADYEQWARDTDGMPSGQTIRTQLGLWSRAKAEALTMLAERGLNSFDGHGVDGHGADGHGADGHRPDGRADHDGADGHGVDSPTRAGSPMRAEPSTED